MQHMEQNRDATGRHETLSYRNLRRARWLVVALYSCYLFTIFCWWSVWGLKGTSPVERLFGTWIFHFELFIPMISSVGFIILYTLLISSKAFKIAQGSDKHLSVQQRMKRDQAYRYSYRIITALFLLVPCYLLYHLLSPDLFGIVLPLPTGDGQILALFFSICLLVITIPTAVIAWINHEEVQS